MKPVDTGIEPHRPLFEIDHATPPTLTPEMLAQDYAPLIRRTLDWVTANTTLCENQDELFQAFFLWATTPGTRTGRAPIASYDPARSPVGVFVRMQVRQYCFKQLLRESRSRMVHGLSPDYAGAQKSLDRASRRDRAGRSPRDLDEDADVGCQATGVPSAFASLCAEPDAFTIHEQCRNELFRLIDRPQYQQARTFTASGVPRCTATIVKLLLSGDLSQREIGKVLDLSPNEVGRRLKALRSERWVQELAAAYGYPIDR